MNNYNCPDVLHWLSYFHFSTLLIVSKIMDHLTFQTISKDHGLILPACLCSCIFPHLQKFLQTGPQSSLCSDAQTISIYHASLHQPHSEYPECCTYPRCSFNPSRNSTHISPYLLCPLQTMQIFGNCCLCFSPIIWSIPYLNYFFIVHMSILSCVFE